MNSENIQNILKEKERLKTELDRALSDVDQLKSLLAQNTIKTLQTQIDDEGKEEENEINYYQGDDLCNKTFDIGYSQHRAKKKKQVPVLDFSNLK